MAHDIDDLIKKAKLRSQVFEKKIEANETEQFLLKHPNIRPGITPISADYIYQRYKAWKGSHFTERRWFFRRFPPTYARKYYEDGTYYLLDKRLLIMTEEEEKLYAKKAQRKTTTKK